MKKEIPIEISARHIHLSQVDLEALFGKGYQLEKLKNLTQPGQFAAKETLTIQVGKKKLPKVRIVGPVRKKTQIELSITDALELQIKPPVRKSGDIKGSSGAVLAGSKRKIKIKEGIIVAWRHIHCTGKDAKTLELKNGMTVSIKTGGGRSATFHNVKIRVAKNYRLCMHIDTDEGNAAGIKIKDKGEIL